MTTMQEIDVRCAVCGASGRYAALSSTSSFGPPDLDLRPQGPGRWALEFSVQRCRSCGYCAGSIGQAPVGARETVDSVVYRDVLERSKLPRLARTLFCAALVVEGAGLPEVAAWRFLEAAWACDDKRARAQARTCRERAVEMFRRALETGEAEPPVDVVLTLVSDLLRRAGRHDEAIETATEAESLCASEPDDEDASPAAVARFIRELAQTGDDEAHNAA
jgi:hypothetical protein